MLASFTIAKEYRKIIEKRIFITTYMFNMNFVIILSDQSSRVAAEFQVGKHRDSLVVECVVSATRATRIRFPADAN